MSETASFLDVLRRNGHVLGPQTCLAPLSGGVSSEIYFVEDGENRFVVKRALAKLRVEDSWFADVARNVSECKYLKVVDQMMPGAVPQLYFSSPESGYFGMEYLGDDFENWKHLLLTGNFCTRHAELAGNFLGEIHRRTAHDEGLRRQFDTTANFHQLRVEPYLLTAGARNPALRALIDTEARRLESIREALVHGDFSPKNILIRGDRMVVLDCEVAWYGDPTFDVAFLLNHLLLKSLHHAPKSCEVEKMIDAFWHTYVQERSDVDALQIEQRLVPLLLMLLLARVDGKSPVEYLTPRKQHFVRAFVRRYLPSLPKGLTALLEIWCAQIVRSEFIEADA